MYVMKNCMSALNSRLVKSFASNLSNPCCRTLYSAAALGIDNYAASRERIISQFANTQDRFKSKMKEFTEGTGNNMIFTEDLKSIIHLAQSNESDLTLVHEMIKKFNQQNKELRFGNFVFGPVIMRMYHFLNKPEEALAVFKDQIDSLMFDQLITYHILLDLLFINKRYEDILEVFNMIKDKQIQGSKYPKNAVVLFAAACYKLNTPESFKLITNLWQELKNVGHIPMRRATTFAAALALKQNAPHIALEIISTQRQQNYVTVRNIRAAALADLGRSDDAIASLRSVLLIDDPDSAKKQTVFSEVVQKVRESVQRSSNKDLVVELDRIEKQLNQHNMINNELMEDHLCSEIAATGVNIMTQKTRILAESYNRRSAKVGFGGGSSYPRRPGLADMN